MNSLSPWERDRVREALQGRYTAPARNRIGSSIGLFLINLEKLNQTNSSRRILGMDFNKKSGQTAALF